MPRQEPGEPYNRLDLTEALVRDFDTVMEKNMRQHLGRWFR